MDIRHCNIRHVKNRKVFTIFFKIFSFRQMIECCTNSSQSRVSQVKKSAFWDKRAFGGEGWGGNTTHGTGEDYKRKQYTRLLKRDIYLHYILNIQPSLELVTSLFYNILKPPTEQMTYGAKSTFKQEIQWFNIWNEDHTLILPSAMRWSTAKDLVPLSC